MKTKHLIIASLAAIIVVTIGFASAGYNSSEPIEEEFTQQNCNGNGYCNQSCDRTNTCEENCDTDCLNNCNGGCQGAEGVGCSGSGYDACDGIGNRGFGPKDGTGYGSGRCRRN